MFRDKYFSKLGVHEKCMKVLVSYLSGQYHEQDEPYIDENAVRSEFKRILENKLKSIDFNLKVRVNKNNDKYNDLLIKKFNKKQNTELDLQIIDSDKNLIAAYELKSLCNENKGPVDKIYQDFHRLSLIKAISPDVTAIFIIVGIDTEIKEYFIKNNLLLPYKHKVNGEMKSAILNFEIEARISRMPVNISMNDYQELLSSNGFKNMKYRISQRPYSLNLHAYSFEILEPEIFEVRYKIGESN